MNDLTSQPSSTSHRALSPDGGSIPVAWVEDLFSRLVAILGGAMSNVYAGADPERVKKEWAEALAGYSAEEVKRGIAGTRTRKFAPNLPEFLNLCRPALDSETAWIEAEEGMRLHLRGIPFNWSHPAVYWAAREMQYDLRTGNHQQHRRRWDRVMAQEWAKGAWACPPDPTQKALPAPEAPPAGPSSEMAARLKAMREALANRMTVGA